MRSHSSARFAVCGPLEGAVAELLRGRHGGRAVARDHPGALERLVEHGVGDGVDEAAPQRLLGAHVAPGEDQLLGEPERRRARQALAAAPAGDQPERDLGLPELGVRRRVADVAGERDLAAAAERVAVDGRDRGLRHRLEQTPDLVADLGELARLLGRDLAHVLEVGAADEGAVARAGEHDAANARVLAQLAQARLELADGLDVERVQARLAIDLHQRDRSVPRDDDAHTRPPLSIDSRRSR